MHSISQSSQECLHTDRNNKAIAILVSRNNNVKRVSLKLNARRDGNVFTVDIGR